MLFVVAAALPATARANELSPEVQLALQHLREGERARLEKAQGPLSALPLYRVQLEIEPEARRVTGQVHVLVTAKGDKPQDAVYLRVPPNAQGRRMRLSHATRDGKKVGLQQPEPTLFKIDLEPPLAAGASTEVSVKLVADVPSLPRAARPMLGGLGGGVQQGPRDYGAFAASEDVLMLSGIVPMVPPKDFDGEPWPGPSGMGDLALFDPSLVVASILVPAGHQALATGVALGEVPEKDGRVRFSWAAAGVRDFPVIVTRGFKRLEAKVNGIDVETWHSPANAEVAKRAQGYTVSAISELEKRLGPLPHRVFRVVEAPLFSGAGGMEFSGLIVLSRGVFEMAQDPGAALGLPQGFDQLLGGGAGAGAGGKGGGIGRMLEDTLELTVAHEVAHQYFAGLVGSDPVREPVADEALAQYLALLYFEWKHGAGTAQRIRLEHLVTPYHFYRMGGGKDGAAARHTESFAGSTEYAALVYGKAPLGLAAQRKVVGDALFFRALRAYVDEYRWGWACTGCFTSTMARLKPDARAQLEAVRRRWWNEAKGDEDLGKADFTRLLESMSGQKLDAETAEMLRQLMPIFTGE